MDLISNLASEAFQSALRLAERRNGEMEDVAKLAAMRNPAMEAYEPVLRPAERHNREMEDVARMAAMRDPAMEAYESALRLAERHNREMEDVARMAAMRNPAMEAYESALRLAEQQNSAMDALAKMASIRNLALEAITPALDLAQYQNSLIDALGPMLDRPGYGSNHIAAISSRFDLPSTENHADGIAQFRNLVAVVSALPHAPDDADVETKPPDKFDQADTHKIILLLARILRSQEASKSDISEMAAAIRAQPGPFKLVLINILAGAVLYLITHYCDLLFQASQTAPRPTPNSNQHPESTRPSLSKLRVVHPTVSRTGPSRRSQKLSYLPCGGLVFRVCKHRKWSNILWFDIFLRPHEGWVPSALLRRSKTPRKAHAARTDLHLRGGD